MEQVTNTDLASWLTQIWDERKKAYERAIANPYSRYLLASIVVERKILELHAPEPHPLLARRRTKPYPSEKLGAVCGECSGSDDPYIDQVAWPCQTVLLLASLYADRPGFREEWR